MIPQDLRERLERFPRISYGNYPTPLEPLDSLGRELGIPGLWIKRDDGLGPGMGGNKGRPLEFLMADILNRGKRRVVTYGGLQSNHARMTAAACAGYGLEVHLLFFERRPAKLTGNLLLDDLFGARMHFIPIGGGGGAMSLEATNRLVRFASLFFVGPGAYFMPVGGFNVIGCLGYVGAAVELHEQVLAAGLAERPVTVIAAVGTGGTVAGLLAGLALLESPIRVLGLDIGKLWKGLPKSLARMAESLCLALGERRVFLPEDVPIIEGRYAEPGYGRLTDGTRRAIGTLARTEGMILDPVYSGKAFAGLLDLFTVGHFGPDQHVIFLHSGGTPGLWAYGDLLSTNQREEELG